MGWREVLSRAFVKMKSGGERGLDVNVIGRTHALQWGVYVFSVHLCAFFSFSFFFFRYLT